MDRTRETELAVGQSIPELISRSQRLCDRLGVDPIQALAEELEADGDSADLLRALRQTLESLGECAETTSYERICSAYELAMIVEWTDETGERDEVLSDFAFLCWRYCRRFGSYRDTKEWEARCVAQALRQDHVRDFVALTHSTLSDDTLARFLGDPPVLLALCHRFQMERNANCKMIASESVAVLRALERLKVPAADEERAFFNAELAVTAATALRHIGEFNASEMWLQKASAKLRLTVNPLPYQAIVDFASAALSHDRHDASGVLEVSDRVRSMLESFGIEWHAAAAGLLHAGALKDVGRLTEALESYRTLAVCPAVVSDPLLLGLTVLNTAEVESELGGPFVLDGFRRAEEILYGRPVSWAFVQLQASVAECLRDHGLLAEAIEVYRMSAQAYADLGMKSREAYLRLLLAEILIACDKAPEAVVEIGKALPVASQEAVMPEVVTGVSLLQEALRKSNADPAALDCVRDKLRRTLRECRES